jgi:tRNA(Ile)-lysidine synthase TilS/MesJ
MVSNPAMFNRNYGKWFVNDTLRAIRNYRMIETGETVCVALSGGKDSITLLYILDYLRRLTNLKFDIIAAHIRTGPYDTSTIRQYCIQLGIEYHESDLEKKGTMPSDGKICSICSRLKRGALSKLLSRLGIRKAAFGHHSDDVAETLFMNMIESKKLGSFSPKVELPDRNMIIIRPLIYLPEKRIRRIHEHAFLPLLKHDCPFAKNNNRNSYKKVLDDFRKGLNIDDFSSRIVGALENIDHSNMWENVSCRTGHDSRCDLDQRRS